MPKMPKTDQDNKGLPDTTHLTDKEAYVQAMFNGIARYYDAMNLVMTGGQLKLWHRKLRGLTGLEPGQRGLDVACGTGDLTLLMAGQVGTKGSVVGLDFAPEMLRVAKHRVETAGVEDVVELVEGNAMDLPFSDNSFDCATTGFALRNVADIPKTLQEMTRVVKPGGNVISLEVSKPESAVWRRLFFFYFYRVVPVLGTLVHRAAVSGSDLPPYTYLPHSLTQFPNQAELAGMFEDAGLTAVKTYPFFGGVAAIHRGVKRDLH